MPERAAKNETRAGAKTEAKKPKSSAPLGAKSGRVCVRQLRSAIGRHSSQLATLRGLGLGRIGRVRCLEDTPSVRGMIAKVGHLIVIEKDESGET